MTPVIEILQEFLFLSVAFKFESKFWNITYLKSYTLKTEVSIEMGYIAFSSFQATSYKTLQTFVAFR